MRNFPDLKVDTGFSAFHNPSDSAILLGLMREAVGHTLLLLMGNKSMHFPLNPVDLLYGTNIRIFLSFVKTTLSLSRVVLVAEFPSRGEESHTFYMKQRS